MRNSLLPLNLVWSSVFKKHNPFWGIGFSRNMFLHGNMGELDSSSLYSTFAKIFKFFHIQLAEKIGEEYFSSLVLVLLCAHTLSACMPWAIIPLLAILVKTCTPCLPASDQWKLWAMKNQTDFLSSRSSFPSVISVQVFSFFFPHSHNNRLLLLVSHPSCSPFLRFLTSRFFPLAPLVNT